MIEKTKYIPVILLPLFIGIITEPSIPHYHDEENDVVVPDFSKNNYQKNKIEQDSEQLHATFYFAETNFSVLTNYTLLITLSEISIKHIEPQKITVKNYNILPKICNIIKFFHLLQCPFNFKHLIIN